MTTFKRILKLLEDSSITQKSGHPKGISVEGVHYSHKPNLTHLQGKLSGTGITGSEQKRLGDSDDPRIKSRVYFYEKTGDVMPRPEQGLGPHIHTTTVKNIYDPKSATDEQKAEINEHKKKYTTGYHHPSNTFESAVLDAGYHGYKNAGMVAVLGQDSVPVQYKGKS